VSEEDMEALKTHMMAMLYADMLEPILFPSTEIVCEFTGEKTTTNAYGNVDKTRKICELVAQFIGNGSTNKTKLSYNKEVIRNFANRLYNVVNIPYFSISCDELYEAIYKYLYQCDTYIETEPKLKHCRNIQRYSDEHITIFNFMCSDILREITFYFEKRHVICELLSLTKLVLSKTIVKSETEMAELKKIIEIQMKVSDEEKVESIKAPNIDLS
jgi:hypothetical protein